MKIFKTRRSADAIALQQDRNWGEALKLWDDILTNTTADHSALIHSGNCLIKLNRYEEAEKRFTQILVDNPDDANGLSGLATTFLKQEKLLESQETLFRIKHLYPDNLNTHLMLCQIYIRFRQYATAKKVAEEAIKRFPDNQQLSRILLLAVNASSEIYDQDGLWSKHNHDFMSETSFTNAYNRGVQAAQGQNYNWHWRVHTGLWAASTANKLEGDFVECGVNRGFLSSSIMTYLDWDKTNKQYYLLDTFTGIDPKYVTDDEVRNGILEKNKSKLDKGSYTNCFEDVKENFSEWNNIKLIKGTVPDTLSQITTSKIAFLHLDMNAAEPEKAALEYLWDKLTKGALILLDDYAYKGYDSQHIAMKKLAEEKTCSILSLPTGQGLIVKTN